jgi:hypothetical protein
MPPQTGRQQEKAMRSLVAWLVCMLIAVSAAMGRDYYVATQGDDSNPGAIQRDKEIQIGCKLPWKKAE